MGKEEWVVDYGKSEVITFVVQLCFSLSSVVDFKVKVKVTNILLSVSGILYFKLI